ncbi:MAG: hypothetical protein JST06_06010 [Bacteroidetes bacterium]|nr:hypothetical protein [Bacteroidota bacterium]MBS1628660.1 hypothetical protein [Bacteroidota bacterium]
MRPCLALLFICLLAFQTLPLAALSQSFGKVRMTAAVEEEENGNSGCRVKGKSQAPLQLMEEEYHPRTYSFAMLTRKLGMAHRFLHAAEMLPAPFAGEVATPPPNYC